MKHKLLLGCATFDSRRVDILEGKVREGQTVQVDAKDGVLSFRV